MNTFKEMCVEAAEWATMFEGVTCDTAEEADMLRDALSQIDAATISARAYSGRTGYMRLASEHETTRKSIERALATWHAHAAWEIARTAPDLFVPEFVCLDTVKVQAEIDKAYGSDDPPIVPGVTFRRRS